MLFMGQEILEDKYWSDSPNYFADSLIWWDGLGVDRRMQDHLHFVRDLIALRRSHPGLTSDSIRVFHVHNDNRVLAFHRWVEGAGEDVVVVANFREDTAFSYSLGFPRLGTWFEIFNSDVYENYPNPIAFGNQGRVVATGPPMHGFGQSAQVVLPANSILVFSAS
jgi:1,4-alpha-glucan branching enzyme